MIQIQEQEVANGFCDCLEDGFCPRYQRDMAGRFRAICQGVDVDLGTAAAFREQWAREAPCRESRHPSSPNAIPLLLKVDQQPGDVLAMTAAVYSLHEAHPSKYATVVDSFYPSIFDHNPDVGMFADQDIREWMSLNAWVVQMHYPAIHRVNDRAVHFMQGWCEHLERALGVPVPLATNRPRLYFPDPDPPVEDFWVVCSGGKQDFTNKMWGFWNYQSVVSRLRGKVRFVQVGATASDHSHPRLEGAEDMVGRTTLRQLFELVRRARGVLCGVSLLMHVAAALERPAVVIAGGRESVQWNSYPKQQYLHTVGVLPCRSVQGHVGHACWRSRTVPLGDGSWYDRDTCERPTLHGPECMGLISPSQVIDWILRYDKDGVSTHRAAVTE